MFINTITKKLEGFTLGAGGEQQYGRYTTSCAVTVCLFTST